MHDFLFLFMAGSLFLIPSFFPQTQEAEAIATALFPNGNNPSPTRDKLLVGSVKTIIGHTEGTAGLASLIASSQALQHRVIPPNMWFQTLNPKIEPFFEHLEVPTTAGRPWPPVAPGQPRRVSINSFGGCSYLYSESSRYVAHQSRVDPLVPQASGAPTLTSSSSLLTRPLDLAPQPRHSSCPSSSQPRRSRLCSSW